MCWSPLACWRNAYTRVFYVSRAYIYIYMHQTTMRRWWLRCRWLFAGWEGGVASVASAIKCVLTRKLTCSRLAFIETPRARDRNSKVQACLRVMQIGLKAERVPHLQMRLSLSRFLLPRLLFRSPRLLFRSRRNAAPTLRRYYRCRVSSLSRDISGKGFTWNATVKIARIYVRS